MAANRLEDMIDNFSLLLSHSLVLIACWRLLSRPDLDSETPPDNRRYAIIPRAARKPDDA